MRWMELCALQIVLLWILNEEFPIRTLQLFNFFTVLYATEQRGTGFFVRCHIFQFVAMSGYLCRMRELFKRCVRL
jgi:hypothetical protein